MNHQILKEYNSLLQQRLEIESILPTLPQGYISQKTIKGKSYTYLQNRVSGKVTSRYLKSNEIDNVVKQLALRKQYEAQLPQIFTRLSELEQAAHLVDKNASRGLMLLKLSAGMDQIDTVQKMRSSSFANAMNAIEGISISKETEQEIAEWRAGTKSFLSVFETTLKRYGFPAEV